MPNLVQVTIYNVHVKPSASQGWSGSFDFDPNAEDVAAAIRMDLVKLKDDDPDMEIKHLSNALDLVKCNSPYLTRYVKVAGMFIGSITTETSQVFVREVESMMPPLHPQTTLTQEDADLIDYDNMDEGKD